MHEDKLQEQRDHYEEKLAMHTVREREGGTVSIDYGIEFIDCSSKVQLRVAVRVVKQC